MALTADHTDSISHALLGVSASATGRIWTARTSDDRAALVISQTLNLPEIIGRVLAGRGVGMDEAAAFLDPRLKTSLPDPSGFAGMDAAVERIAQAIVSGEPVAVFGDYDVDGATSAALLTRYFRSLGIDLRVYVPDRLREGYGPNGPALQSLAAEGIKLVITVDCGTAAHQALEVAQGAGLDVIVTDHHQAPPDLPPAVALVNPNRLDDTSGQGMLAAVGVVFLVLVALNRALRERGYFTHERHEPDLMQWLDLVALGTVCDVVPLSGLNRPLVLQGLKVMAARRNAGLAALADLAGLESKPGTYHAGFVFGPRVNAGGRVGEADMGARLLATDDPRVAAELAQGLDSYNRERQAIEKAVVGDAIGLIEASGTGGGALIVAAGVGWHPGVIGIAASRLKERYGKPAFVIALDNEGQGKGSGRSVPGFDMGAAVTAARQAGLLINGGGHKMAAGLTLARENLDQLTEFLTARAAKVDASDDADTLKLDGVLDVGGVTRELYELLQQAGPFGSGNPAPRFAIAAARIQWADVVGENHIRCTLVGPGKTRLKAISFRSVGTPLGDALLGAGGSPLHLAGRLDADDWRGRHGVQLNIEDAAQVVGQR